MNVLEPSCDSPPSTLRLLAAQKGHTLRSLAHGVLPQTASQAKQGKEGDAYSAQSDRDWGIGWLPFDTPYCWAGASRFSDALVLTESTCRQPESTAGVAVGECPSMRALTESTLSLTKLLSIVFQGRSELGFYAERPKTP